MSDLDELGQRKAAATALYANLDSQEYDLDKRMGVPTQVRGRVVDILAYARWAAYAIFTATTWTAAQQLAWAGAMLTGPSDAADLDTLIQKSSALTDAEVPITTSRVGVSGGRRTIRHGGREGSERTVERRYRRPNGPLPRKRRMDSGYHLATVERVMAR